MREQCAQRRFHQRCATLRVTHVRGAAMHRHHKCALLSGAYTDAHSGNGACSCCACTRSTLAQNGCPCGSADAFFKREWRMAANGTDASYWWSWRPKPGTRSCEVRGEVRRDGVARGVEDGDIFADGHLTVRHGRLSFNGAWTQPSDSKCPELAAANDGNSAESVSEAAFSSLHGWMGRNTECGFMHFFVDAARLEGEWRYRSWPAQENWAVDWKAPLASTVCAPTAGGGVPACSVLHANTLSAISADFSCAETAPGATPWQQPMTWSGQ